MLGITQGKLAEIASVSKPTVTDFERGARTPIIFSLEAIQGARESAGVEFIDENGGGPGVRLVKP